jgi:hypothetical protein
MPLKPGKRNIGHNIKVEEAAGKPHKQAVAIAMNTAHKKKSLLDHWKSKCSNG